MKKIPVWESHRELDGLSLGFRHSDPPAPACDEHKSPIEISEIWEQEETVPPRTEPWRMTSPQHSLKKDGVQMAAEWAWRDRSTTTSWNRIWVPQLPQCFTWKLQRLLPRDLYSSDLAWLHSCGLVIVLWSIRELRTLCTTEKQASGVEDLELWFSYSSRTPPYYNTVRY